MKSTKLYNKNFFFMTLRRNMPLMLLFSVVMFMGIPMIILLSADTLKESNTLSSVNLLCGDLGFFSIVISSAFGVFAGCSSMRQYMNKRSAVFFGALPVRREKQFASFVGAGAVCYAAAVIITGVMSALILGLYGASAGTGILIKLLLQGTVWFFFFYALTAFFGALCGLTSIQFLFTCTALFYIPVTLVLLAANLDRLGSYNFIDFYRYLGLSLFRFISPVFDLVYCAKNYVFAEQTVSPLPAHIIIIYAAAGAVLLCLAALMLRSRKHSLAGQPVVYRAVAGTAKYAVMIPAALLIGIIFEVTAGTTAMLIGFAVGALLAFMLMNVILSKNPRAYFTGLRGLAVFAAAFAVSFGLIWADPVGVNEYIPGAGSVTEARISFGGYNFKYTDESEIKAVNDIIDYAQRQSSLTSPGARTDDKYISSTEQNTEINDSYDSYIDSYGGKLDVDYKLKSGLTLSKSVCISDFSSLREQSAVVFSDKKVRSYIAEALKKSEYVYASGCLGGRIQEDDEYYRYDSRELTSTLAAALADLIENGEGSLYREDCGPAICTVSANRLHRSVPIYLEGDYADAAKKLAALNSDDVLFIPTEKNLDDYLSFIVSAGSDGKTYTDREEIKELWLDSIGLVGWEFPDIAFGSKTECDGHAVIFKDKAETEYESRLLK